MANSGLRHLPSVEKLLSDKRIDSFKDAFPHDLIVDVVRKELERERFSIVSGNSPLSADELIESIANRIISLEMPGLRPVINASGVILHTNLGRAPISRESVAAMQEVAGYCNLEYDLDSGARGSRNVHIEPLLCQLTGAEAALVVNNNAAAVLLCLTALARRREVIVSRGQAVEIGGGFRIPDVMRQSGAKLVEVGATNCTYIADYEEAITPRTAALMRVHSSNFKLVGFTSEVTIEELAALGKKNNLTVFDDVGSGCFIDTTRFGLAPEPMVPHSIAAGASLVCFSGDKLVGGPQAGIIVGKKELVDKLKKHPLVRAIRVDKIRLAGLIATLIHYLKGEALKEIPVWRMISTPLDEIDCRAQAWAGVLNGVGEVADGESMVGGGSLPGATLPTRLVTIAGKGQNTAQVLSEKLRHQKMPVIGRISGNTLLLDPRSVLPEDDGVMLRVLKSLADGLGKRQKG